MQINNLIINDIYLEKFIYDIKRYNILIGGRGSGKSYAAAQKIIIRCLNETGNRFLIIRKTLPALKRSCWTLINNIIDNLKIPHIKNKTELNISINNNVLMFVSMDDPEKIKSIEGITSVWIEEVSEITENEFRMIDLCLRGQTKNVKQIIASLNPINEMLWINSAFCYDINLETENYKVNEKENKMILKTTYLDNTFIDEEYKILLQSLKSKNNNLYRISTLGLWGGNRGLVYNNYETRKGMPDGEKIYGIDFGFNNPTVILEIVIRDKEYFIKQILYESGMTNNDLIKQMNILGLDKNCSYYCDCAEPARIEELKRNGYNVWESDKDITKGIDCVKSQKLYIEENSTDVIKEIKTYCWEERKDGTITDKPVKEWDHAMDAMRYAIYTHSKLNKQIMTNVLGVYDYDQ